MSIFKLVQALSENVTTVDLDPVKHSSGIYGADRQWNAIKWIDGLPYRDVVQCLIIKDQSEVFLSYIDGSNYVIPGGSKELEVSDVAQVRAECMEEAHAIVDNILFTGIEYSYENKYIQKTNIKNMMKGKHVSLYVADYVETDDTIDSGDLENPEILKGRFYKITEIFDKLFESHKRAIFFYYTVNKLTVPPILNNPIYRSFDSNSKDLMSAIDSFEKKPLNEAGKGDIDAADFDLPEDEEEELDADGKPKKKKKSKDVDPEEEDTDEEVPVDEEDNELNMDDFDVDTDEEADTEDDEPVDDEEADTTEEDDSLNTDDFDAPDTDGEEPADDTTEPVEGDDTAEPAEDGTTEGDGTEDDSLNTDDFDAPDGDTTDEPAEDGATEDSATEDAEEPVEDDDTIVNVNILKLTSIERAMADRRIFVSLKDLYQKALVLKGSMNNYKVRIEGEVLEGIEYNLDNTVELLKDYIDYKFGINNYEENSKAFVLFSANVSEIIKMISESIDE